VITLTLEKKLLKSFTEVTNTVDNLGVRNERRMGDKDIKPENSGRAGERVRKGVENVGYIYQKEAILYRMGCTWVSILGVTAKKM